MNNYARVPAIEFDKVAQHRDSVRARNEVKNPEAIIYLKLKSMGKIIGTTYKEWNQNRLKDRMKLLNV